MLTEPGKLILATLVFVLASPLALAQAPTTPSVDVIDVSSAMNLVSTQENTVIVDVRTPAEYESSHITDAVNINVQNDDFEALVSQLDPNTTYIVHCTKNPADGRSSRALGTLQSLGFRNLYSLEGGYVAWKDAELPLTEAESQR